MYTTFSNIAPVHPELSLPEIERRVPETTNRNKSELSDSHDSRRVTIRPYRDSGQLANDKNLDKIIK